MRNLILMAALILSAHTGAQAQVAKNSPLFIELKKVDSVFFERGFNQCDIPFLEKAIADDLRFYHDKGGFQNRQQFFENTKNNLCSDMEHKPIRKVVENSLEVFPLYNNETLYGAIQQGVHRFYIREKGKEDQLTGIAKFTSVWVLEQGTWKLSEVLSYDHK